MFPQVQLTRQSEARGHYIHGPKGLNFAKAGARTLCYLCGGQFVGM